MSTYNEIPPKFVAHVVDILYSAAVGTATLAETKVRVDNLLYALAVEGCQLTLLHKATESIATLLEPCQRPVGGVQTEGLAICAHEQQSVAYGLEVSLVDVHREV